MYNKNKEIDKRIFELRFVIVISCSDHIVATLQLIIQIKEKK